MRSGSVIYRALVARSRMLWDEQVRRLFQVSGAFLIVLGTFYVLGVIW